MFLNRLVVERLTLLAQAKSTVELAQFSVGDCVDSPPVRGVINALSLCSSTKRLLACAPTMDMRVMCRRVYCEKSLISLASSSYRLC